MAFKLNVNGKVMEADVDPDTPLLWTLRDTLGITGPKYGIQPGTPAERGEYGKSTPVSSFSPARKWRSRLRPGGFGPSRSRNAARRATTRSSTRNVSWSP